MCVYMREHGVRNRVKGQVPMLLSFVQRGLAVVAFGMIDGRLIESKQCRYRASSVTGKDYLQEINHF